MTNLKGKNAVITGASRGIGKAVALRLAKEGVNVMIAARNQETLDQAVAENERRVKELTLEAQGATARYDYRKLAELLEDAEKLQAHNEKLFRTIDRTERKLSKIAEDLANEYSGGGAE